MFGNHRGFCQKGFPRSAIMERTGSYGEGMHRPRPPGHSCELSFAAYLETHRLMRRPPPCLLWGTRSVRRIGTIHESTDVLLVFSNILHTNTFLSSLN